MPSVDSTIQLAIFVGQILFFIGTTIYAVSRFRFNVEALETSISNLDKTVTHMTDKFEEMVETQYKQQTELSILKHDVNRLNKRNDK